MKIKQHVHSDVLFWRRFLSSFAFGFGWKVTFFFQFMAMVLRITWLSNILRQYSKLVYKRLLLKVLISGCLFLIDFAIFNFVTSPLKCSLSSISFRKWCSLYFEINEILYINVTVTNVFLAMTMENQHSLYGNVDSNFVWLLSTY